MKASMKLKNLFIVNLFECIVIYSGILMRETVLDVGRSEAVRTCL